MVANSKIIAQAAQSLCMKKNEKQDVAYGVYNNFSVLIYGVTGNRPSIVMALCGSANGEPFKQEWLAGAEFPKKVRCSLSQYRVNLSFPVAGNVDANVERVVESIQAITKLMNAYGCANCDERGIPGLSEAYSLKGNYVLLSQETAAAVYGSVQQGAQSEAVKNENYIGGIIGAILGSLVGAIVILLIAQLGRIATIGGIVMGIAIVFGYKKLGKKFSIFSVIICSAISVLMTYITCQLSAAIDIYKAWDGSETLWYCFTHAKEIYEWADSLNAYNHNFILMMIVGVVGTIVAVCVEYSSQKQQFQMYKLD